MIQHFEANFMFFGIDPSSGIVWAGAMKKDSISRMM
jgi:hypothetical protein